VDWQDYQDWFTYWYQKSNTPSTFLLTFSPVSETVKLIAFIPLVFIDLLIVIYTCRSMGRLRNEVNKKDLPIKVWFINRLFAILFVSFMLGGMIASFDVYVRSGTQNEEGYGKYTCMAEVFWLSLYTFIIGLLMVLYMPREYLSHLTQKEDFVIIENKDNAR